MTFQVASEFAKTHPDEKVLVIDLCPQANASSMLLGGIIEGEERLVQIASRSRRRTIAGYIEQRIASPYLSPKIGADYVTNVHKFNSEIPPNLFLVVGDESLEMQASRVSRATNPGPNDAWRLVHGWIRDLIADIRQSWNVAESTVFIDWQSQLFGLHGISNVGGRQRDHSVFSGWVLEASRKGRAVAPVWNYASKGR